MLKDKICYFNNEKDKLEVINNNVYVNGILLKFLDSGVDGFVYKYKDKAIKLYRDNELIKEHLTNQQIAILCSLSTKHLVLPEEPLISNDKNFGFVMSYINLETKKDILLVSKNHLIKELQEIENELELMGKNHFLLNDRLTKNLFYNGNLYLFDPDSFLYDKKVDFSKQNLEIFVWHFIRDIIFNLNNKITKEEQLSLIRKLNFLYNKGNYYSLSSFLESFMTTKNLQEVRQNFIQKKVRVINKY